MKKLLVGLAIFAVGTTYADSIDLVNTHVTCNKGSYTLTGNSTQADITHNCTMYKMEQKHHAVRANKTELEFTTDQYKLVECTYKKGVLDECKVKKKN